ncbi:amino acid adenylation domain-containing protein [Rhodococcus sp. D2-41]|uniref:amino acid adenylation domain-containing protein n=1 Tax=Speluncibacter jeojiensis TaxID=2710754 RepID=UPI00240F686B|nr:amino acid adenylation domain-containing protein [Rhodococcus sp. D2-41]MDG3009875.1 amino acid adenylation domain-containing protein [Rhodococcus sp. D2-41]
MSDSHRVTRDEIRTEIAGQLGISTGEVADDTDLIALGLDSIRMMKLAGGWRKQGFDINFAVLAADPTLESWFGALGGDGPEPVEVTQLPSTHRQLPAVDGAFALAPMQHAYWVGRSQEQELGGVAAHLYVEFDGDAVDPDGLRAAVERLTARHPMLRAQFLPDGTQRILPAAPEGVFTLCDLRGADDADAELERLREAKTHQRLDVDRGQVLDVTLTLLPHGRSRMHLDVDMLAADAMSYRVLTADLARLVRGDDTGPDPDYTYAQYLADNGRGEDDHDPDRDRDRAWWAGRLLQLPDAPALPLVPETERREPHRTVRYHHALDPAAKARLLHSAHAQGVTPAMALASVFAETIGHWSAQPRFLLNLPLFGREPLHPDIDRLVGDFTSSVLLDVDVTAEATVLDRARVLQRTMYEAGTHSSYGGLEVLRDLGRHHGRPVIAPIVYTSALGLGELFSPEVTDTFGEPVWFISQGPQVLLDAQVTEVGGGLLLNWDVRASAFPPGLIDAMFAEYTATVDALGTDPHAWSGPAVRPLPEPQHAVRQHVNDTDWAPGRPVLRLHERFFARAGADPDRPAVVGTDGDLSYGELADRALAVAGALRAAGLQPGDAVAVQLPKGADQIVAVLGVLAAGGAYVPIGSDQPEARRERILTTASARIMLTDNLSGVLPVGVRALTVGPAGRHPAPLSLPVAGDPEQIAYVLFTSGTTGVPKGVEVPHRAAMGTIDDLVDRFGIGHGDRTLAISALEFDLSVFDIFAPLAVGGAVVLVDEDERRDPARWATLVREHAVTVLNCVPSVLDLLLRAGSDAAAGLRVVLLGGDWVGVDLPVRLRKQAPDCRFAGLGGTTETAIHSTVCEVGEPPADWTSVPYGTPLRGVRCRVVDAAGRDCPDWVPGELWIGGHGVARGYRGDSERTADRFVRHDDENWYRTGDLALYRTDGMLEFLGRADSQVKIRGYRVELGEVEAALRGRADVHRAVAAVTAVGSLVAAVSLQPDVPADPDWAAAASTELAAALVEALPPYMIPERIEVLDEFPLSTNGKLDRRAVLRLLDDGATERPHVAPRGPLEEALADILGEVIGVVRIGVTDDIFTIGADSVLATAAVTRIRHWLDVPAATVSDIFATRTVAALAARLAERDAPGRLDEVARLYLEVARMDEAELDAALLAEAEQSR